MMLETELKAEFADTVPDNSDPNLAVAEWLPDFRFVIVGLSLVKAGDIFSSLSKTF